MTSFFHPPGYLSYPPLHLRLKLLFQPSLSMRFNPWSLPTAQQPSPSSMHVAWLDPHHYGSMAGLSTSGGFRHGRTGQPPGAASVGGRNKRLSGAVRALLTIILGNWHIGAPCGRRRPCDSALHRSCVRRGWSAVRGVRDNPPIAG